MPVFKPSHNSAHALRPLMIVGGLIAIMALASCGIKPDQLSAPGGDTAPSFPAPYPQ